jgi:membrane-bound serine protease (ClpP class)
VPTTVIDLRGAIDDYAKQVLLEHIDQARKAGSKTIIFRLNTPGGALGPTLELTRTLRGISDLHTIAYIDPMAYSAGTIIAVACDEIVMAPESALGDCAPIAITDQGLQTLGEAERAKMASPVVADMYASAQRNGYDGELLAAMVIPSRVVHALRSPDGHIRFADDKAVVDLLGDGYTKLEGVPDPLDSADTLLTLDNQLALKIGLSKANYPTVEALALARNLTLTQTLSPTSGQKIVQFLNSSAVRGILVTVFMISLYLAFQTPGHGLPEAVALFSLATLIVVPLMTGYASWFEIMLILVGIALIAVEAFLVTGTIIPGLAGAGLLILGIVLTFVPRDTPGGQWSLPSMPSSPQTWTALESGFTITVIALLAGLVACIVISQYLPRLPIANRLVLADNSGLTQAGGVLPNDPAAAWPPIGTTATAVTDLRPSGNAEFPNPVGPGTRTIPVVSDSGYVNKGTPLTVTDVQGSRVLVRPAAIPTTLT